MAVNRIDTISLLPYIAAPVNYNIPNMLTFFRLGMVPIFLGAFFLRWYAVAFACFVLAGGTDLVDGYIARRLGQGSRLGAILDPIADKLLMAATFVSLASIHLVPWWFVGFMLFKDVFILAGIGYFMLRKLPFDYQPVFWSKAATLLLIIIGTFGLLDLVFPGVAIGDYPLGDFMFGGVYVTAGLILITVLTYLLRGLEILQRKPGKA